ncbi:MAG: RDD family protein [Chitinophagaceae bacterium]|nr:RDD family protein [Chitinophagaceae bacterium]
MSIIKVPTSFNIDLEFEIPEFYRRLIALLIDFLVLFFYYKIAGEIYNVVAYNSDWSKEDTWYDINALRLVLLIPFFTYHLLLEITMNGQSVGKKIMGLKVVNENGGRPSISQFLIRWILRDIWFLMIFQIGLYNGIMGDKTEGLFFILFVLAYFVTEIILVAVSKKSQRIGDLLARTILIRTNARTSIEETVFQEVADNYKPSFPQIMHLSDKDINAIKSILETAKKKGDFNMAATASEKIKAHLKINSDMSPFDFLEVLLKDYNYLSVK